MEEKKPFYVQVAEQLIDQLKQGTAPWQRPWEAENTRAVLPINAKTGNRYKGLNMLQLLSCGYSDPRWLTYKQAQEMGAQVRKGEKGTVIQYVNFREERIKLDGSGQPLRDNSGEIVKVVVPLERPKMFSAVVFNAEQIEGLPALVPTEKTWDAVERAEKILTASQAKIVHVSGNKAFYRPSTDEIQLPERTQFKTAAAYYATALHEIGHWTGHQSRLARDLANPFGSEAYAREELRAEIASMILGEELAIGHDPGQHAAYVASWIKALQEDRMEIVRAAADAEKIHNYVLSFEQKKIIKNELGAAAMIEENPILVELINLRLAGQLGMFLERAHSELGAQLVRGWTGAVRIVPVVHKEGGGSREAASYEKPMGFHLYGVARGGEFLIKALGDIASAELLADQLRRIDACSQTSDLVRDIRLAMFHEERIKRNPSSTYEQIIEAKNHRKNCEYRLLSAELEASPMVVAAMELKNFIGLARVEALEGEKKKWEVFLGTRSLGFSNAQSMIEALEDIYQNHKHRPVEVVQPEIAGFQGVTYINVPFKEKEQAKALGAKWDKNQQSWYVPAGLNTEPFSRWLYHADGQFVVADNQRQYLAVPYENRDLAKSAGAIWDPAVKSWYVGGKGDMQVLEQWLPKPFGHSEMPAMTPREEFANFLREMGCLVDGKHPIMDGQNHRIAVQGEKAGSRSGSGFYVAYLDGRPAGYAANHKTGQEQKWKYTGGVLSADEKACLATHAAAKLKQRGDELRELQEATALKIRARITDLVEPKTPTPYLQNKGIEVRAGIYTDDVGEVTYIPAYDVCGEVWAMQFIQADGEKRFAKNSRKEGCFHVVGGFDKLQAAQAIVICEGYATAATVAEAVGFATVAAFDSSNLVHVGLALKARFQDKLIVFMADDDRHLIDVLGLNPGKSKAEEAARLVGGHVLMPTFAPGEQTWPENVPRFTKEAFYSGTLTVEQEAAYKRVKQYTDFNDLANKSVFGKEGVARQVAEIGRIVQNTQHAYQNQVVRSARR